MSLKATAFNVAIQAPKTASKFLIMLPGSSQSLIQVTAASLPYQKRGEAAVWFMGTPVYLPTLKEVEGTWSCTLTETNSLTGALTISMIERTIKDNCLLDKPIIIMLTDEATGAIPQQVVVLKHAWLKEIKPTNLDWSKPDQPITYELTFRYSSLKKLL